MIQYCIKGVLLLKRINAIALAVAIVIMFIIANINNMTKSVHYRLIFIISFASIGLIIIAINLYIYIKHNKKY